MTRSIVMISRHPYGSLMQGGRCLAPTNDVDIHLVTHARGGADGLDPAVFGNVTVCDSQGEEEVRNVSRWLVREYAADRIVAVHEKVILLAAELRAELGLTGLDTGTAMLFRDKVRMKQTVVEADAARVPSYRRLRGPEDLRAVDWSSGRKVVKSCFGAGSQDVYVVDSLRDAEVLVGGLDLAAASFEVEEYIEGKMYHCDAVVQDGEVTFAAVSEYLSKPGDYTPGGMGGSVLLHPAEVLAVRTTELNARVLRALGLREGVTHLEVFHTPEDELVFCEVAARPAGGGIDRIIERSYGINVLEASLRLQAGLELTVDLAAQPGPETWAVIGFYPGHSEGSGVPEERFEEFGIAEHVWSGRSGDGVGGVRHCTDYQDKYVLRGSSRSDLDARVAAIRRQYLSGR